MDKIRTVVHTEVFSRCCEDIAPSAPRLEDQLAGIEWAVATAPGHFAPVPGTSLRILTTDPFPGAPALVVYFRVPDDNHVELMWVELANDVSPDLA